MSDSQIFQIFGFLFLFIWLSSLLNKNIYKKILDGFISNFWLYFLTWGLVLLLWFIMIAFHNVWELKLTVIITILWWMSFIKGAVMLILPEWTMDLTKKVMKMNSIMAIFSYPILILWLVFLILGYL